MARELLLDAGVDGIAPVAQGGHGLHVKIRGIGRAPGIGLVHGHFALDLHRIVAGDAIGGDAVIKQDIALFHAPAFFPGRRHDAHKLQGLQGPRRVIGQRGRGLQGIGGSHVPGRGGDGADAHAAHQLGVAGIAVGGGLGQGAAIGQKSLAFLLAQGAELRVQPFFQQYTAVLLVPGQHQRLPPGIAHGGDDVFHVRVSRARGHFAAGSGKARREAVVRGQVDGQVDVVARGALPFAGQGQHTGRGFLDRGGDGQLAVGIDGLHHAFHGGGQLFTAYGLHTHAPAAHIKAQHARGRTFAGQGHFAGSGHGGFIVRHGHGPDLQHGAVALGMAHHVRDLAALAPQAGRLVRGVHQHGFEQLASAVGFGLSQQQDAPLHDRRAGHGSGVVELDIGERHADIRGDGIERDSHYPSSLSSTGRTGTAVWVMLTSPSFRRRSQ